MENTQLSPPLTRKPGTRTILGCKCKVSGSESHPKLYWHLPVPRQFSFRFSYISSVTCLEQLAQCQKNAFCEPFTTTLSDFSFSVHPIFEFLQPRFLQNQCHSGFPLLIGSFCQSRPSLLSLHFDVEMEVPPPLHLLSGTHRLAQKPS